jgi:serine/threonine-protein kinase
LRGKDLEDTKELPPGQAAAVAAAVTVDSDRIPAGMQVGPYVIQQTIAAGGGGTVYAAQATDAGPDAPRVAIKVMLRELAASRLALSRFQREVEVVRLIDHPSIVSVIDSGSLPDGRPYIVMELVSGENLRTLLLRRGRFSAAEVLEILAPVCSALQAAHAAGVIHRDLKASNICVGTEGGAPVVKLLDFGIAKLVEPDPEQPGLTVKGTRLGTPYAMPPEQIRGEVVDARADIYSLGVLVYQLLTGSYPFVAGTPQEIERLHIEAAPPRPSRTAPVAAALDAVVLRCLEKRPEARFQSVADFLAALRAAAAGQMAAPAPAAGERDAVGVYVEVRAHAPDDDGVAAESLEDDAATVMDIAEQTLQHGGLDLPLQTSNALLGTRLLPAGGERRRQAHLDTFALAAGLVRLLADRPGAQPGLEVKVCLHVARAVVRGSPEAPHITGGPILNTLDWIPLAERDGVRLTPEGAEGL